MNLFLLFISFVSANFVNYVSTACMFGKALNLLLFFKQGPFYGLSYAILCLCKYHFLSFLFFSFIRNLFFFFVCFIIEISHSVDPLRQILSQAANPFLILVSK